MSDWSSERDPDKAHLEVVHDADLGTIAQITHPDGTVVTAADVVVGAAFWGSASVDVGPDGTLSNLRAPAEPNDDPERPGGPQ